MFTPLILFLGLTVATAVIAHWSDNLGKKLGKKRVSLFGLRPRTTATILTVASSWGIMLFTLAALLITVAPLRRALFFYDRDISAAKQELGDAQTLLATTRTQFGAAKTGLEQANRDLETANQAVKKSQENVRNAIVQGRKRTKAALDQADKAEKAATSAQKRVVEAQKRVVEAQKRFVEAQQRERAALQRETAAQDETDKSQRAAARARRDREEAQGATRLARRDLRATQTELGNTRSELATAKISVSNVKKQIYRSGKQLLVTGQELSKTNSELIVLQKQRAELGSLAAATLRNDAPVKFGQTFAARIVPADQNSGGVAAQLRQMLKQAQQKFAETEDLTPNFPSGATLQLLPLTERGENGRSSDLRGERLVEYLARRIAGQTTSVRLVAPRNYLADETQIGVIFVPVPLAPAFDAGQLLASATIDGAQGDARIFRSLLDLLDLGQREAEKRGVNPPQSPDEPNFYAAGTNVSLFAALRFIESSKRRLRVDLVADKALSTVEPLQIRFEVEGESGANSGAMPRATPGATPNL